MTRRPKIVLNSGAVRALLNDPGVRAELERRARDVLAKARETAPVDTGEHRDSLHIEHATTDRAAVRIVADSDHSLLAEVKTGHLARALDAAAD